MIVEIVNCAITVEVAQREGIHGGNRGWFFAHIFRATAYMSDTE